MKMAQMKKSVPYFTLERQNAKLRSQVLPILRRGVESGKYILGPEVDGFENAFAKYCGSRYGVGVASGTDALILALRAIGLKPGDEVIVPSFTFVASVFSILHAGGSPVFAEVDPKTYTLDPNSVKRLIHKRTKAILPVHLYGQTADMGPIMTLARRHKLRVIEDTAQAHGSEWRGRKAGSMGDIGCFSFYPTKNLGAFGDGGMLVTNSRKYVDKIKRLRNLGRLDMSGKFYEHEDLGVTSRLDSLQAAVLRLKLQHLDAMNNARRKIAAYYQKHLADTPLGLPLEASGRRHVYHLFVVRVPQNRESFRDYLREHGISTMVHYPTPCHLQPALKNLRLRSDSLPVTARLCREIVSLPMFPEMTQAEAAYVCRIIHDYFSSKSRSR